MKWMEGTFNTHTKLFINRYKKTTIFKNIKMSNLKKQHTGRKAQMVWLIICFNSLTNSTLCIYKQFNIKNHLAESGRGSRKFPICSLIHAVAHQQVNFQIATWCAFLSFTKDKLIKSVCVPSQSTKAIKSFYFRALPQ